MRTEHTAHHNSFGAVLKNRRFMLLWIGQLFSQLADKILLVLQIALLSKYLTASQIDASGRFYLYMAFTIPAILFGSLGGVIVDRVPKKLIMVGSDAIRGVLTLLIPFLPREFAVLLLITCIISTVTQFFAPAEQATIPLLVRHESLMTANALFSITMMGTLIVGNAIGDQVLRVARSINNHFGQELIVGALYILSAIVLLPINYKEAKHTDEQKAAFNPLKEFVEGLRYLKKNRIVWNSILQIVVLYSVFAALIELAIRLATSLGLESTQYTFFVASAGIGMVIGAAFVATLGNKLHSKSLPVIGFTIMALVLALLIFVPNLPISLILCVFLGMGGAFVNIPMQTTIQQQTPPAMHGKVFGFQNHAVNIALSAPLLITTRLANAYGLQAVLLGMSIIVAGIGIWSWRAAKSS